MNRDIVIDPVTRIEGHATITIRLDDTGQRTMRDAPRTIAGKRHGSDGDARRSRRGR